MYPTSISFYNSNKPLYRAREILLGTIKDLVPVLRSIPGNLLFSRLEFYSLQENAFRDTLITFSLGLDKNLAD